jgi:hypothetical protein
MITRKFEYIPSEIGLGMRGMWFDFAHQPGDEEDEEDEGER